MPVIHLVLVLFSCSIASLAIANDLDDGIAIDEKIDDSLKKEFNSNFIVSKSKSRAKARIKRGADSKTILLEDGVANSGVGNIQIGAGADLQGATIINLSTNNDSAVITD